jgi:hypothetical protein
MERCIRSTAQASTSSTMSSPVSTAARVASRPILRLGAGPSARRATLPHRRGPQCSAADMGALSDTWTEPSWSLLDRVATLAPQTKWPPLEDLAVNRVHHLRDQEHFESELELAEDRLVRHPPLISPPSPLPRSYVAYGTVHPTHCHTVTIAVPSQRVWG